MSQLSSRELLFLEDASKLFESIDKTCQHATSEITDSQIKSLMQSISSEHRQWIQSSASLVTKGGRMQ
ncbi:MAG: hypothetical protein ACM3MK_04440 [Chitinophagales bacterium]